MFEEFKRRESAISIDESTLQERLLTSYTNQLIETQSSSLQTKTASSNFFDPCKTAREPWILKPGVNTILKQKICGRSPVNDPTAEQDRESQNLVTIFESVTSQDSLTKHFKVMNRSNTVKKIAHTG